MNDPLVSVVVSSYNRPRLIRDAIDSVLAQTWQNVQIIIADDWSNGETTAVLQEYEDRESRVYGAFCPLSGRPTAHERQFGQRTSVCINAVMKFVQGDFVAYLPDDDVIPANSIEVRARYLMKHPEANCVYGRLRACISDIPVAGIHWEATAQCRHDDTCFWSLIPISSAANRVDHGQFFVRRIPTLPIWPEHRAPEFDCDDAAFLDACERAGLGPFFSVPQVVIQKRYHQMGHRSRPDVRE